MRIHLFSTSVATILTVGAVAFMGCQGATDGGPAEDGGFRDDVFVGDETSNGSIDIELSSSELAVGDKTSFRVIVTDSQGQPVPNINIVCDSEDGIAIIEPSKGYELTGQSGGMSGVIGCEAPGSYQMVCRLNIGANRRKFVGVKCTGDIPPGFTGFPGAGGGGLGGGSQTDDDGDVQIIEAGFEDDGQFSEGEVPVYAAVDISQDFDCDNDPETAADIEPFYDTYAALKIQNNLSERISLLYLTCSVKGVDGTDNTADCGTITLTRQSDASVEGSETNVIFVPIFKAYGGDKFVGNPTNGTGTQITSRGFYSVTFKLYYQRLSDGGGDLGVGDELPYLTASATAAFGDTNRCE